MERKVTREILLFEDPNLGRTTLVWHKKLLLRDFDYIVCNPTHLVSGRLVEQEVLREGYNHWAIIFQGLFNEGSGSIKAHVDYWVWYQCLFTSMDRSLASSGEEPPTLPHRNERIRLNFSLTKQTNKPNTLFQSKKGRVLLLLDILPIIQKSPSFIYTGS